MKKIICLILALILCLGLLAGCGSKEEVVEDDGEPVDIAKQATGASVGELNTSGSSTSGSIATPPPKDATYQDSITILLDAKVPMINPFNAGGKCQPMGNIYYMLYDTLVTWTLEGDYVPCLATEWSTEDNLTWNFKLRDDVTFHNGEHMTADDVVFSWENALTADGCGIQTFAKKCEYMKALGDYEIEIKLKNLNPDFIDDCSGCCTFVVCNRKACEEDPENGPMIATGPYYVEEFKTSEYVIYKRWDKYFDADQTHTETVTFRYVAEETARMIMLDNGEADFGVITSVYIPQYANNPQFVMTSYCVNNCGYIALNCSRAPMDDVNFRWACAYAISRDEIVDVGFSGYSMKAPTGGIWGYTTKYRNPDIPDVTQDIEKAKEYLAKSSYDGRTIQIYAAMSHTIRIATVFMSELVAIGINAEVSEVDGPTLSMRSSFDNNDMDIIVNSNVFGPTPTTIRYCLEKNDNNKACYVNEEALALSDKGLITPDGEERQEIYYRIQQIMFDEQPYIPTTHNALYTAGQAGTGGAKFFPNGYNDYSCCYRIIDG